MNNMVMINGKWFNLDQFQEARFRELSTGSILELGDISIYGPEASALWDFMTKHSYNIVLEEKE